MSLTPPPAPTQTPLAEPSPQAPDNQGQGLADPWNRAAEEYASSLSTFLQREVVAQIDHEKNYQYLDIGRNHAYLRGYTNYYLGQNAAGFVDYLPQGGGADMRPGADTASPNIFGSFRDHHFALYQEFVRKFVAVLGVRSPNVRATALEPDNEQQHTVSRLFQELAEVLRYSWNADKQNRRLPQLFATDGVCFIHTPWKTDRVKYGSTQVPSYSFEEQPIGPDTYSCPNCLREGTIDELEGDQMCPGPGCDSPVTVEPAPTDYQPIEGEPQEYANGAVEFELISGLMVTTPYYVCDPFLSDCPFLIYEYEKERSSILEAHPELHRFNWGEYAGGSTHGYGGYDELGRTTREQISSYSGVQYYARANRWLYSQIWVRPHLYQLIKDKPLLAWLQQNCPDGAKITAVNTKPVRIEPSKLDDEWVAVPPEQREFLYVEPYFTSIQNLQDLVNHSGNITAELMEGALPRWLIDLGLLDIEELQKGPALPREYIPVRPGPTGRISERIYQFKPGEIDPAVVSINDWFTQKAQNITGMLPALWGGDEGSQTATEAQQKRNQSMQMLWTVWANMAMGWAKAYWNGARQFARRSPDMIVHLADGNKVPVGEETRAILQGGFRVEPAEAMPMTSGQRRDYLMDLVRTNSPQISEGLGLFHPTNLGTFQELLGIPGIKFRGVDAYQSMQRKIQEMLNQPPIIQPNWQLDPATGQMKNMGDVELPSEPPDPSVWDPPEAVMILREWIYVHGDKVRFRNQMGYKNIRLYLSEWFRLAAGTPPEPGGVSQPPSPEITDPGISGLLEAPTNGNGEAAGESAVASMPTPDSAG